MIEYYTAEKKEGAPTLCNSMDGTEEHYAKWNKPGSERQMLYDLTFKWNLTNKTNKKENITRDIEIKKKLTVTKGDLGGVNGRKGERIFRNNCKGHMDKTKGQWNQERVMGMVGVGGGVKGGKGRQVLYTWTTIK